MSEPQTSGCGKPLRRAAAQGDLASIKALIFSAHQHQPFPGQHREQQVSPNDLDGALLRAAEWGQLEAVRLLCSAGASCLRARDRRGNSVLHVAARAVNPSSCDAASSSSNVELLRLLLELGAEVAAINALGQNALHCWAELALEDLPGAELLLLSGTGGDRQRLQLLQHVDEDLNAPLHVALGTAKPNLAELFIRHGADVNAENSGGIVPLYLAVAAHDIASVKLLISRGAHIKGGKGSMALLIACAANHAEMIDLLLNSGVELSGFVEEVGYNAYERISEEASMRVVAKYVAKIQSRDSTLEVGEILGVIDKSPEWRSFYLDCHRELECMSAEKMYGHLSFYDALFEQPHKLVCLLRNGHFVKSFKSSAPSRLFPIYAHELEEKFGLAEKRRDCLDTMKGQLEAVFHDYLPDLALERILHYLSDEIWA
ncbi:hypothetical protein QAD02_014470 [Eretmocerus hayati]|uniref:Uncharacterized protein n=1 Tax=Eretmocerus hayati TaxID=131215 RepID=A0ACC2P5D7_9HYME|nr:hypothetical protein QAD02_014470 [Eretmocerus hayati]